MKRIISVMLCVAMMLSMFVITSSAATTYDLATATALYTPADTIAAGGSCLLVCADSSNAYAQMFYPIGTGDIGQADVMVSFAYCLMGTYGDGATARICIGSGDGLSMGYDLTNSLFFISDESKLFVEDAVTYDDDDILVPFVLTQGAWENIAFRFTATQAIIYLNGAVVASANYSDFGKDRSGWVIYYPKNIKFYADNYMFFANGTKDSYSVNLGSYTTGSNNLQWGNDECSSATLGDGEVYNMGALVALANASLDHNIQHNEATYNALSLAQSAYDNLSTTEKDAFVASTWHWVLQDGWNDYNAIPVIEAINSIGTVTYSTACKAKIDAARSAYNSLADANWLCNSLVSSPKEYVTNYSTLTAAETTYAALKAEADQAAADAANQAAADPVIALINSIGTVTLASGNAITEAEQAYAALTDTQKTYVYNYSTLTAARATHTALVEADAQALADAMEVDALIDSIEYPITLDSATSIFAAKNAYDLLSDAAKAYVTLGDDLDAAVAEYDALVAADEKAQADAAAVDSLIAAIGEVTLNSGDAIAAAEEAYADLSDAAKAYVQSYSTLTAARTAYDALVDADSEARADAAAVDALITAIGDVTLNSGDAIAAAEEAYADLSDAAKAYVAFYGTLTAARTAYDALVDADSEARADAAAVDALISAIGDVTLNSGDAIAAAEEAYADLSDAAKAYVTLAGDLTAARTAYDALVAADDQAQADAAAVDALIAAIGEVTLNSGDAIAAAEEAYADLSDAAKAYVTLADELADAAAEYDALVAYDKDMTEQAEAVAAMILALDTQAPDINAVAEARAAYDNLPDEAKERIGDDVLQQLLDAEANVTSGAADEVEVLIEGIASFPKVKLEDLSILDMHETIAEVYAAYNALTVYEQALVENSDTLFAALAEFNKAIIYDSVLSGKGTAPTGVTATGGSECITVSWDAVDNASAYWIYVDGIVVAKTTDTGAVVAAVAGEHSVKVSVAVNYLRDDFGLYGAYISGTSDEVGCTVADGFTADISSFLGRIVLDWTPVEGASLYYVVFTNKDTGVTSTIKLTDTTVNSYVVPPKAIVGSVYDVTVMAYANGIFDSTDTVTITIVK